MANQPIQRPRVTPPHVSLKTLRKACHLTLDEVCTRVAEVTGKELTRGALSAIESGIRGASAEVLAGLAHAYDIDVSDIDTLYQPRARQAAA